MTGFSWLVLGRPARRRRKKGLAIGLAMLFCVYQGQNKNRGNEVPEGASRGRSGGSFVVLIDVVNRCVNDVSFFRIMEKVMRSLPWFRRLPSPPPSPPPPSLLAFVADINPLIAALATIAIALLAALWLRHAQQHAREAQAVAKREAARAELYACSRFTAADLRRWDGRDGGPIVLAVCGEGATCYPPTACPAPDQCRFMCSQYLT